MIFPIALPAAAATLTVEPDDFALGTDISTAVNGVTLSLEGPGFPADFVGFSRSIFVVDPTDGGASSDATAASTGTRAFGTDGQFPPLFTDRFMTFVATFDDPIRAASINVLVTDVFERARLSAFTADGTEIDFEERSFNRTDDGPFTTFSVGNFGAPVASDAMISTIRAAGVNSFTVGLDNLRYIPFETSTPPDGSDDDDTPGPNVIPLPAGIWLMGAGLGAFALVKRRRRRHD
jgi:hypothetical protein